MRLTATLDWRDPVEVAAPFAEVPWSACLLSDGGRGGRWSWVMSGPDDCRTLAPGEDWARAVDDMSGPREAGAGDAPSAPCVLGLAAYELGSDLPRDPDWPDLMLARYPALLAFDHLERRVVAVGCGADETAAGAALGRARGWLAAARPIPIREGPLAADLTEEALPEAYRAAVADVVGRIAAGEIFQANIARGWRGRLAPGVGPFDVFARLARTSPAPYAAWWRLPGRALVSNSPEQFLEVEASSRRILSRPIKGTRPRGSGGEDARLAEELRASAKDRAENLMIVDLMRNDLSRVCAPGSVGAPELFGIESYANVHHLVSTIEGRLRPEAGLGEILAATFPPGSITGAPKVRAMKVIAGHEPPRGPWCGSLFLAGADGSLEASVLIRTLAMVETAGGWDFRTCAGAGIVADSEPDAELAETGAKLAAIRAALCEGAP